MLNFFSGSLFSRFLDTVAVVFFVLALSFCLIRSHITVESFNLLWLFCVFLLILLSGKISSLNFSRFLPLFVFLATGYYFFLIAPPWKIFPSLAQEQTNFLLITVFSLFFYLLVFSFLVRSYLSRSKILLRVILFFALFFFLSNFLAPLSSQRSLQKLGKHFEIKLKKPLKIRGGDPLASLRLNPAIDRQTLAREEKRLAIGQPVWRQYLLWLDRFLFRGDLGTTQEGQPVLEAVRAPLFNSLLLNLFVLLISWTLALVLGSLAALYRNCWLDRLILSFSSISLTTPAFLLAILILGISAKTGLGKIGGLSSLNFASLSFPKKILDLSSHLFWPVAIMSFVSSGALVRQFRANILDVLQEDYIKAAQARGLSTFILFKSHLLPNAINPLVTLLGFEFANLLSGSALTEMILAYPGIGSLTLEAAQKMDINLIMFSVTLGILMLVAGNLLADFTLSLIDPRISPKISPKFREYS